MVVSMRQALAVLVMLLLCMHAACATCLDGGTPTYDDVSYISVGRFTMIAPQTRQFSATLNRIRWVPENPDKQNTLYSGWLRQRDDKPLKPGFYSFENAKAQTLFEKLLDEIQRSDFYSLHLTPYKGHYVDGPYDGITVGRCGVLTTLTFAPLGTSDTEVPDGDDAHAKRFSTLLDSLENAIYAAPGISMDHYPRTTRNGLNDERTAPPRVEPTLCSDRGERPVPSPKLHMDLKDGGDDEKAFCHRHRGGAFSVGVLHWL